MTERKGASTTEKGSQKSALAPWEQQLNKKYCRVGIPLEQKQTARDGNHKASKEQWKQEQRRKDSDC